MLSVTFGDPNPVGVDSSVDIEARAVLGFYASVAGTLTITGKNTTRVIVNAAPVVAGWNPMPFKLARNEEGQFTFTTAGGGAGWIVTAA